jgi:hypothetical protein
MCHKIFKILIFAFVLFSLSSNIYGQEKLHGNYVNLHLKKGNYELVENIYVTDSLIIDPGVNILFGNNTSITIEGSLDMQGVFNDKIYLIGKDSSFANGLQIRSVKKTDIQISFVHFEKLNSAINFINDWYRPFVNIINCEFVKNTGKTNLISILNPYLGIDLLQNEAKIIFDHNLFAENKSPIYLEDLNSNRLDIKVTNNTFVENLISGNGFYTYYTNVVYGRMDKLMNNRKPIIQNNVFKNNYLIDIESDTLVQDANFGVYGSNDTLLINNNVIFIDKNTYNYGLYDNTINYTSPQIVNSITEEMNINFNPIFISNIIDINNKSINYDYDLKKGLKSFLLESNRPINTNKIKLIFRYTNGTTFQDSILKYKLLTVDSTHYKFTLLDTIILMNNGFLEITAIKGLNNEYVANSKIGYLSFLKHNFINKIPLNIIFKDTLEIKKTKKSEVVIKRRYEFGLVTGYSIYSGSLSNNHIFKNDINSNLGFQFKYIFNKRYSTNITIQSLTLTGSDLRSGDSTKIKRGMSFKTPIIAVGVQFFRDFNNNKTYYKNKIIPSFGFGFDYIKFNPMGEFLGKWYNLQSLGTGGQNLPNSKFKPYSLSTLGAVLSGEFKFFTSRKTIIGTSVNYHFTFTNFLDDVGPTIYPTKTDIVNNTKENTDALIYFSNPSNMNITKQQLRSGSYDGYDGFLTFNISISRIF